MSDILGGGSGQRGSGERGAGTEGRRWIDGPRPAPVRGERYEVTERAARIPMRDGVELAATIFEPVLPAGAPPQPAVVVTNGYAGNDYRLYPNLRRLAGYGYPVVEAKLRGVGPRRARAGYMRVTGQTATT